MATAAAVVATPVARGGDSLPTATTTVATTASVLTAPSPEPAPTPSPDPAPATAKLKPAAPRQTTTHAATAGPAPVVSAGRTEQTKTVTRARPPHVASGHVGRKARRGGAKRNRAAPAAPLRTQTAPPPSQTLHREGLAPSRRLVGLALPRPARLSALARALAAAAGLLLLLAVLSRRPVVARHFNVLRPGSGDAAFVLAGFAVAILLGLLVTLVGT